MRDLGFGHEAHVTHQSARAGRELVLHLGHARRRRCSWRARSAGRCSAGSSACCVFSHAGLQRQQRAQLRVAILLDDEVQSGARARKLLHFLAEREAAHAHVVELHALRAEARDGLAHGAVAAAERDDAERRCRRSPRSPPCGTSFVAVIHFLRSRSSTTWYSARILGVGAVLVVAGAAREVRALGMHARQRALRNAVVVVVDSSARTSRSSRAASLLEHLAAIRARSCRPT